MKHQQDDKTFQECINWWELHKPSCLKNHSVHRTAWKVREHDLRSKIKILRLRF